MDIPVVTFVIAGGFALLAIGDRGIKDMTQWHSNRMAAASEGLDRFHAICTEVIEDDKAPEEVIQVAVFLSEQVGNGSFAKTVLKALQGDTRRDVAHLLEFLPHDMPQSYSDKLVSLVRAALTASVPLTWKPRANAAILRKTTDPILVAAVVGCLDC